MNNGPIITLSRMEIPDPPLISRPRFLPQELRNSSFCFFTICVAGRHRPEHVNFLSDDIEKCMNRLYGDCLTHLKKVMGRDVYHTSDHRKEIGENAMARPGVTVGVAPTFRSVDRAEKRKEYYMKLEKKQKALEAEKLEQEMRTKEEEEAAIKQLRKTMIVKAHPVPSFYREGPPPKVEPRKIPVTRPKSPNLILSRRRSCSATDSAHLFFMEASPSSSRTTPPRGRRSATSSPVRRH